jgi:hypothetical protein
MVLSDNRYPRHVSPMSRNQNKEQSHYLGSGCSLHANSSRALVRPTCHVALLHCSGTKTTLYYLPSHFACTQILPWCDSELGDRWHGVKRVFERACTTRSLGRILCLVKGCCVCFCCRDGGAWQLALVRRHSANLRLCFSPAWGRYDREI